MDEEKRKHLDKLCDVALAMEKAEAILNTYRDVTLLDIIEPGEQQLAIIQSSRKDNALLFYSAQDYLAQAISDLQKAINEA